MSPTLDFYFRGYVSQTMYSVRIHNIDHSKKQIREAAASATPDVFGREWQEMEYCLNACRTTNGAQTGLR
jgi:hypothetical protein